MAAAPVPATERTAASRPWAGLDPVEPFPRTHLRVSPTTPDGQGVGTLCAVERVPRALTDAPVAPLSDLARLVVASSSSASPPPATGSRAP